MNRQIIVVGAILLLTILLFEFSTFDIWLQDYLYDFELHHWLLSRDDELIKFIFYDGIKKIIITFVILVFVALLFFKKSKLVQANREGLLIVLLAAMFVPLVVGTLKATTNIPCPNDLNHYGGQYPHVTLFTSYPQDFFQAENISCYPAGHASGGFALLSLVFLFKKKRNRVIAAVSVLTVGWAMGIYKMLIGDHFLSHTIVTMILAWLIILIITKSVYRFTRCPRVDDANKAA